MIGVPGGEKRLTIYVVVSTLFQCVTYRWTDGQTDGFIVAEMH